MDYLTQAKTFLERAKTTSDIEEKVTHLDMAVEMLGRAIEEPDPSHSWSVGSGLSSQELSVLELFQKHDLRPGQLFPIQSILLAWGTRGSKEDLLVAMKRLELTGLLVADAKHTGYLLTEAGFVRP